MKFNKTLFYLGLTANVLTGLFILMGGTGGSILFSLFWFCGIWIVTFVTATILTIWNRKEWFSEKRRWTIFSFILCTPMPIIMVIVGLARWIENGPRTSNSIYTYKGGQRIKIERWIYDNRQTYLDKYYKADSLDELTRGEAAFLKDSIWIYYSKDGEIVKKEKYKDDQLVSTE